MKFSKFIAISALALAGVAVAAPQSASVTKAFDDFVGYGVKFTVDWDSPVQFELATFAEDQRVNFAGGGLRQGSLSALVMLMPGASVNVGGLERLEVNASVTMSFINLATGADALPSSFYTATWGERDTFYSASMAGAPSTPCVSPGAAVELRFSNSKCSFSFALTGSGAQPDGRLATSVSGSGALLAQAGNFLRASDDPECASFACMTPGHDLINRKGISFYATATVGAVPEPSVAASLAVGLVALTLFARRRRV